MRRACDERGFALVAALAIMVVILGLGIALLTFTDNQQSASLREQASESSFNVAEAALNAQIGQLSREWPTSASAYPTVCTSSTSTATNGCPTSASLTVGYPNISPLACPERTLKDSWGSELSNEWTTYVRDNAAVNSTSFDSATEQGLSSYDANGDGKLWVRSVGVVQCRVVSVISLISRQLVSLSFPTDVASGSWFEVTNSGKHKKDEPVVNTAGEPPGQPGEISMRCEPGHTPCEKWEESKKQIAPYIKGPPLPTPLLSDAELAALRSEALVDGTLRTPTIKGCPTRLSELSGLPAYVEGCGDLHMTGGVGNSASSPGFLVLADGTLEIKGDGEFYGVIYARNPTNSTGAIVSLGGNATVKGAIDVDGPGGIEFGSNGVNLIYAPQALKEVKTFAGATATRNTFRVLPITQ